MAEIGERYGRFQDVECRILKDILVGIEEVGAQVEQPFEITPMTRLCNVVMFNLEESFAPPIVHHEDEKGMQKGPWKGL